MTKELYRKKLIGLAICIIIYWIICMCSYIPLIKMYNNGFIDINMLSENFITGDYHSAISYRVINAAVFVIYTIYVMPEHKDVYIIRYVDRKKYWLKYNKSAFANAFLLSILYEVPGEVMAILFANVKVMISHKWIVGLIFQVVASTLFLISIYWIYEIIKSRMNYIIAAFITIIFEMLIYYANLLLNTRMGIRLDNVSILPDLCVDSYSIYQCLLLIFTICIINYLIYKCFCLVKKREDLFGNEKQ